MIWDLYSNLRVFFQLWFPWPLFVFSFWIVLMCWSQVEKTFMRSRCRRAESEWVKAFGLEPLSLPGWWLPACSAQVKFVLRVAYCRLRWLLLRGLEQRPWLTLNFKQSLRWKANVLWNQPQFSYHNNLVIVILAWLPASEGDVQQSFWPLKWALTLFLSGILINSSVSWHTFQSHHFIFLFFYAADLP